MKATITASDFLVIHGGTWVAEASDLGFPVGLPMPASLVIDGQDYRFAAARRDRDGEIQGWLYRRDDQMVVIYND